MKETVFLADCISLFYEYIKVITNMHHFTQTMRWFGPNDPVSLSDIRQAGCTGVVTALHQVPVGDIWTIDEINKRKNLINQAGMEWTVIESLPVHEDIKKKTGDYCLYIDNYKQSLRNVAACGLEVVTYNFMPVLDWLRTDMSYPLPDGSRALYFERLSFAVFDLFMLQRPGAASDYTATETEAASKKFDGMADEARSRLFNNALLGLPGVEEAFTPAQVLASLAGYVGIGKAQLQQNLFYFLHEIIPIAGSLGLKMAVHPDDPPYAVLGLPRIVSTEHDIAELLAAEPSAANGLCFCTGSLGARADNAIVPMLQRFGDRVHFLHLRNTKRDAMGNFYEADHLAGDTDMYGVIREVLRIQQRRKLSIPMRPDHGHQMLDDLHRKTYPGYSAIGRLKGLAELRGLEMAISRSAKKDLK